MSRTLHGRCIAVTRPAAQSATLARLIAARGGQPLLFPLLEIGPASDTRPLQQAIASLSAYALVVFISPNAIDYAWPLIAAAGGWPAGLRAAVIGPSSAEQLARHGVAEVVVPHADDSGDSRDVRYDTEALLELQPLQSAAVAGRRILLLRGNGGRELLAETLAARGARVDAVTCYQRSAPGDATPIASRLVARRLDALTLSSSEGLRNLLALLDAPAIERLRQLPVFVPHRRIAEQAGEYGLQRVVLTAPADAGIIDGLCAYDWPDHE